MTREYELQPEKQIVLEQIQKGGEKRGIQMEHFLKSRRKARLEQYHQDQGIVLRRYIKYGRDLPCGPVGKNPPATAGDTVQSPVWEDPTCHRATKPMCQNY